MHSTGHRHSVGLVLLGSVLIAWSGIFVRLAGESPATAAFFRCAYAIPPLVALALVWRSQQPNRWAVVAGVCFGVDLLLWHVSIASVGAGLATVLGNTQVLIVPLVARFWWQEQLHRRDVAAIAVALFGVVLIGGALGQSTYGAAPALGAVTGALTGVAYAGFLLAMRAGNRGRSTTPVAALAASTATAAAVAGIAGVATGSLDVMPAWPSHGWLLALALLCQVLAWLLITSSLVRIAAARVSLLLLVQPLTALLLGVLLLAEDPGPAQWIGALLVLVGVAAGSWRAQGGAPGGVSP